MKVSVLFFLTFSFCASAFLPVPAPLANTLTNIYTDFNGYWASSTASPNSLVPNTSHNLLGFTFNGTTYSTGANDAVLVSHGVTFAAGNFRALPVAGIAGSNGASSSTYVALAKKVDGSLTTANTPAVQNYSVRTALTDGINGLDLGTGITNLPTSAIMTFSIYNINPAKIADDEPDIIITQIAQPVAGNDVFSFIDASGNVVGSPVTQDMTLLQKFGTYDLDLFNMTPNTPWNTATVYSAYTANTNREIRLVGFKLSDFGVTSANVGQVTALKITPSGNSDYAFIAYNANAINIPPNVSTNDGATNTTVCSGGTANLSVIGSAASGGTLAYAWQTSSDGTTWNAVADGGIYSGAATNKLIITGPANGQLYRAIVSETGNPGTSTSPVFTITLNAATPPSAVNISGSATSCLNDAVSFTSSVTGGSNLFYQWQTNASGSYADITDATNSTYAPPVNATGSLSYRLKVSSGSGCPGQVISSPLSLTINGISSVTAATRCSAGAVTLNATPSSGTVSWFAADAGGSSVSTGNSYSPTVSTTTTYYVTTSGCTSSLRVPVTANVDPSSAGGTVNGGTTVVTGTNSTLLTLSGNTGSVLKWQSSTDNFNSTVSDIANTTSSLQVDNLAATSQFRALVQSGSCPAATASPATIIVTDAVMPVHFTSIRASIKQQGILLQWTASEENAGHYEIERSNEGNNFIKISTIESKGADGTNINYSWLDQQAPASLNYYRVKSVDKNGSTAYSSVVKVDRKESSASINFYPNPVKTAVMTVRLNNQPEGKYEITFLNGAGQSVYRSTIAHRGLSGSYTVYLQNKMNPGIYILRITAPDGHVQIQKLTVI